MLYVFSPKFSDGFLGVLHYKQSDLLSLRDTHKPEGVVICLTLVFWVGN